MVIIPWKYKNQYFFYIFNPRPPIVDLFFEKIATYDKIKFPQQANSMVGGTRRNCAYNIFFFANQTENYINFNPTSTKIAKSHFFKKWIYDKIELTSRNVYQIDIYKKISIKKITQQTLSTNEVLFTIIKISL